MTKTKSTHTTPDPIIILHTLTGQPTTANQLRPTQLHAYINNTNRIKIKWYKHFSLATRQPRKMLVQRFYIFITSPKYLLLSERAALGQFGLTTGWLAQDSGARVASNSGLGVGEDGGDGQASWALNVQELGSWCLHQGLQLVLLQFRFWGWVQQVNN